jgi:hypothetical protein
MIGIGLLSLPGAMASAMTRFVRSRSRDDGPLTDHMLVCKRGLAQGPSALQMVGARPSAPCLLRRVVAAHVEACP